MSNTCYAFDAVVFNFGILDSLINNVVREDNSVFIIGDHDTVQRVNAWPLKLHYFICPKFQEKLETVAWKANTLRAVRPSLYIGSDMDTVDQARLLGIPSALYRL